MQKLHLVGFTTDHKSLILSARRGARSGGYVLAVDDALVEAVASAMDQAGSDALEADDELELVELPPPRPQSALSVKELQARLRSGRSIESVAAEAGVDPEWVTRFAAPVLAEQTRVIDDTRNATFSRPRLGPSALRLGPSVYRNLAAKGLTTPVDELDKGWTARQVADGRWLVTFRYVSRGRKQKATWELEVRTGAVRATDRLGGELAFVPGGPKPASPAAAPTKPTKVPASTTPTDHDRATARRVAEARKAAEAQLVDAVRRETKRSLEVARRASSPSAAAARARRAKADAVVPEVEVDVPQAPALTEAVAPAADALIELVTADDVAAVEAAPDAGLEPDEVDEVVDPDPALDPHPELHPDPELDREIEVVHDADVPEEATTRAPSPSAHVDPAASAVAMVREAAEAMIADFASGRLTEGDLDERPVPTWDDDAGGGWEAPWPDDAADADVGTEPVVEPDEDDVPAARAVPTRRRRPPAVARAEAALVDESPASPAVGSRALTRAVAPAVVPDDDGRRRLLRRGEEKVVRTPIDLDGLPSAPARPARPAPVFRDDLASPAQGNGADPTSAPPAAPAGSPRRRRSQPLRAR